VSGAQASIVDVTFNGNDFTIGTIMGSYNDNASLLQSQPWWGNTSTAANFSIAVDDSLGLPNFLGGESRGPLFAYSLRSVQANARLFSPTFGADSTSSVFNGSSVTYAVVVDDVAPIPLPPAAALMLVGLGALGLVRRRARAAG
jgi:hypothetical protein